MNEQAITERFTVNPNVMMGKPTIRGLRITVEPDFEGFSRRYSHSKVNRRVS